MKTKEKSRFDTRIPKDQKEYFEHAASLGGFRTLTEFVVHSVKQEADKIIERHNSILSSKRDQEIFFKALINPPKPNERLKKAAIRFNKEIVSK